LSTTSDFNLHVSIKILSKCTYVGANKLTNKCAVIFFNGLTTHLHGDGTCYSIFQP